MRKLLSIIVLMICLGVSGSTTAQQCGDKPTINDFSPKTGFIGSTVTITGANFSATPANNQVFFGATQATVVSSSFGTLEVRVPEGSTTALISVKNQCNLTAYSKTHFNGVFCPTPLTATSYQNTAQELTGVAGAYNMISQDMDNDGKPDVISALSGVTIAQNNSTPGNINFINRRFNVGSFSSIAIADLDGDGFKDIASNGGIFRNTSTGPGSFGVVRATDSRSVSGYQIGVGDFNNDGKIDIIGSNGSGIYIAFNTSTGPGNFNFTSRQFIANTGHCTGIQVADIDGDGKADFIASQGQFNRAVSIRNTTTNGSLTSSFETPEYWASGGSYPYRSMIADFDKDGKIDFTSCNYQGATNTAIWRNTSTVGNISFAPVVNIPSPGANYRIGVGDVDGDGYPDIVTKSLGVNVFSVYRNTSSAPGVVSFAPRFDYTSSNRAEVSGIAIGDLDGDFVPDIATSGISSNTIRFHRNTGAQNDATPPTVSCRNIVVALSPAGTVTITPEMIDNGSGDACGIESLTLSKLDFTCANIGENTVTLTATDGAGNQSSCTAIVNVQPAAIIVVGQTTVCQGETISASANIGDSYQWKKDGINITGATTQNYVATTSGAYSVEVTNAGGCSGESIATTFVVNENPTVDISPAGNAFLCAPNGTTQLTATQSSIYQWMKNGVDIPDATQQTYDATTVGTYSVRVIDLFGCSAVSEATTVTADPAEIEVSGNGDYGNVFPNQNYTQTITISNTGTGTLDITNLVVSGADAGSFILSGFSSPGSISAGDTTTVDVTFNAANITMYSAVLSFNSNDCDEDFISIPLNAEITCVAASFVEFPSDLLVNNDVDACSAIVNYDIETVGNPASVINFTLSGATSGNGEGTASGSEFNVGTTTVTLTVTNPCGNVTQSFNVVVTDNQAPNSVTISENSTINIPSGNSTGWSPWVHNFNLPIPSNAEITGVTMSFNAVDQGWGGTGGFAGFHIADHFIGSSQLFHDTRSYTINYNGTIPAYNNSGSNQLKMYFVGYPGWQANFRGGTMTVSYNAEAQANNVTLYLDSNGNASINPADVDPGITDNCGIESKNLDISNFDCSNIGENNINLTVVDVNGNESVFAAIVTVLDEILPEITALADITNISATSAQGAVVNYNTPVGTDNCSVTTAMTEGLADGATFPIGTTLVTYVATDGSGNIASASFNVEVVGIAPVIVVPADITVNTDANECGAIVPFAATDVTGIPNSVISYNIQPNSFFPVGTTTVTATATNAVGTSILSFDVIVLDNQAPTAITQDITVTLDEYGNATITPKDLDNGSSDNCTFTLSLDVTTFDCTNIGLENTVTLTVTDASGNTDSTTATVTILEHFKETLDLRSLSSFEAFTGTGAVTNSGNFTGNVGTNVGALTGFSGPNFNGNIHFNDALTAQAELDLLKVYIHLNNIFVTHPGTHAPAFGSGETLTPGVYDIGGAGSVAGNLTLDGLGDPNAVFIMKFKGAFTAGAASNIVLTNGADAANVFWVAQGALSVGANSVIKGTLLAYPGAITLGVNSSIEGRLLSSVGAITVGVGGTAMMPGAMNVPINPMVSYTPAAAVDVLGSIENFSLFTSNGAVANASTSGILGDVGADVGAISGFATSAHIGSFYSADPVTAQAKIDLNNAYTQLMLIPTTVSNHTPAFGSGETLQAGVYSTPGAGSLAGTITLDGQNDPDAIFIFKFNGAFAAAAQSKVILSNGTRRCNVFWISEGAASIGSFSTIKGTVLAHNGAATMGAGGNLEGRLLSTGGAIGFSTGVVYTVVHDVECDDSTAQKTAVKTSVKEAVDTETISFEEELEVYPNPSKGVFNIKLSKVNVQTDIYLFDTTGKLISRKSISKENNSGDLIRIGSNNLSSGIYLVKIITNNKAVTKKVIVEKR